MKQNNEENLNTVISVLEDGKAIDIKTINVCGITDIADYIVIASGTSSKHVSVLANKLSDAIKLNGAKHIGIEGQSTGRWVLVDAHDVIVHIFQQSVRPEYNLEEIYD